METETQTRDHLILAALTCISTQGIRKTSMDDVAHQAGVTRVTVYRHFADKRDLVHAVFLYIHRVFEQADRDFASDPQADIYAALERIGRSLDALPHGNPVTRLEELRRLYPDIYEDVQAFRLKVLGDLFDRLFGAAEAQGLLRPGLNRTFVQIIFWEASVNIFENPDLRGLGLSNFDMFRLFTDILLHGVLKADGRSPT